MWKIINGIYVSFIQVYRAQVRSPGVVIMIKFQGDFGSLVQNPLEGRIEIEAFLMDHGTITIGSFQSPVQSEGQGFLFVQRAIYIKGGSDFTIASATQANFSAVGIFWGFRYYVYHAAWTPQIGGNALGYGSGAF